MSNFFYEKGDKLCEKKLKTSENILCCEIRKDISFPKKIIATGDMDGKITLWAMKINENFSEKQNFIYDLVEIVSCSLSNQNSQPVGDLLSISSEKKFFLEI
ncbi:hypothetical protein MHBO_000240 [Bonamia ostreae]|uniref:Uncharacterized protein n=1 Tax=Bonamia ostreae TaxID=126728 RepID=A0ABV2AF21_9EUKA